MKHIDVKAREISLAQNDEHRALFMGSLAPQIKQSFSGGMHAGKTFKEKELIGKLLLGHFDLISLEGRQSPHDPNLYHRALTFRVGSNTHRLTFYHIDEGAGQMELVAWDAQDYATTEFARMYPVVKNMLEQTLSGVLPDFYSKQSPMVDMGHAAGTPARSLDEETSLSM